MKLFYAWLYRFLPRPSNDVLLNRALSYAMAWGKDWLAPTQSRMSKRFPFLSQSDLDALNLRAREAMDFGHRLAHDLAENTGGSVDVSRWQASVLERFPWVSKGNLRACLSQGKYYAWKDGVASEPHA
jgi:hypothetical protein